MTFPSSVFSPGAGALRRPGVLPMPSAVGAARVACVLVGLVGALAGCQPTPDLRAIEAERGKPVQRTDLFQAAASSGETVVVSTSGGVVLVSGDQGRSWRRQVLSDAPASLIALAACPDGTFAALDFYRKVWWSDTAARQWQATPLPGEAEPLALSCDASGRVWVTGARTALWQSADRGRHWTVRDFGRDAVLTAVHFVDAEHGVLAGEFGLSWATTDGGQTWQPRPEMPGSFYPYSMVFADARHGWASGLGGRLLQTDDAGQHWQEQANPLGVPLYALQRQGDAVFGAGASGQMAVLWQDRWRRLETGLGTAASLQALALLDARRLLVAGANGQLHVIAPALDASITATQGAAR